MLLFIIQVATLSRTIFHGQVLKWALAAFITYRAIQRMRGEQEFDDVLPCPCYFIAEAAHYHAFGYHHSAACFHFWTKLKCDAAVLVAFMLTGRPINLWSPNFNQTHPAHPYRFHFWMVAKYRDVHSHSLGSINNQCASGHLGFFAINHYIYQLTHLRSIKFDEITESVSLIQPASICSAIPIIHSPFGELAAFARKSASNRSIPEVTASIENSPRAHRHLP